MHRARERARSSDSGGGARRRPRPCPSRSRRAGVLDLAHHLQGLARDAQRVLDDARRQRQARRRPGLVPPPPLYLPRVLAVGAGGVPPVVPIVRRRRPPVGSLLARAAAAVHLGRAVGRLVTARGAGVVVPHVVHDPPQQRWEGRHLARSEQVQRVVLDQGRPVGRVRVERVEELVLDPEQIGANMYLSARSLLWCVCNGRGGNVAGRKGVHKSPVIWLRIRRRRRRREGSEGGNGAGLMAPAREGGVWCVQDIAEGGGDSLGNMPIPNQQGIYLRSKLSIQRRWCVVGRRSGYFDGGRGCLVRHFGAGRGLGCGEGSIVIFSKRKKVPGAGARAHGSDNDFPIERGGDGIVSGRFGLPSFGKVSQAPTSLWVLG